MDLIEVKNKELLVDSNLVSRKFGMKHKDFINTADKIIQENPDIKVEVEKRMYRGNEFKVYLMPNILVLLVIARMTAKKPRLALRHIMDALPVKMAKDIVDTIEDMDIDDLPDDRFVYIALAANSRRIKVGISKNPEQRVKHLNTGCPEKLVLIHKYKAVGVRYEDETLMHKKLAEHHVKGEWFDDKALELVA